MSCVLRRARVAVSRVLSPPAPPASRRGGAHRAAAARSSAAAGGGGCTAGRTGAPGPHPACATKLGGGTPSSTNSASGAAADLAIIGPRRHCDARWMVGTRTSASPFPPQKNNRKRAQTRRLFARLDLSPRYAMGRGACGAPVRWGRGRARRTAWWRETGAGGAGRGAKCGAPGSPRSAAAGQPCGFDTVCPTAILRLAGVPTLCPAPKGVNHSAAASGGCSSCAQRPPRRPPAREPRRGESARGPGGARRVERGGFAWLRVRC